MPKRNKPSFQPFPSPSPSPSHSPSSLEIRQTLISLFQKATQPPPPVIDTNPYNVFRPREKAHRPHTRRMQRLENNVQSFEKLRQVSQGCLAYVSLAKASG
ncbi:uncharacterized protein LOC131231045 [Magnolia sinica]|uniref:uncharacterized protein LOC131231045 n=1 Tax=Magnolia sinica TaxID=86752 RepID=UPI00265909A9|nr:uncharacterized protein LOC131231045 [Magnolia sinica]